MPKYKCPNRECEMVEMTLKYDDTTLCPMCDTRLKRIDKATRKQETVEDNKAWREEIAREAAAMYGRQAYDDHMGVSFPTNECVGCGAPCRGLRCEYC